jgi:hypothetical protein
VRSTSGSALWVIRSLAFLLKRQSGSRDWSVNKVRQCCLPKRRGGYVPLVPLILRSSEIMDSFLYRHGVPNLVTFAGGIVSSRTLNGKFKCCTYSSKRSRTSWPRTRPRYTPQYLRGLCCLRGKGACRCFGRSRFVSYMAVRDGGIADTCLRGDDIRRLDSHVI